MINYLPGVITGLFLVGWSLALGRHRGGRHFLAVWLGWAVPGLGHAVTGRPGRGVAFFVLLSGVYATGMTVLSWKPPPFEAQIFYYVGNLGSGLSVLATRLITDGPFVPEGWPVSWYDPGMLYVATAGLLNIVVVLNLYQPRWAPPPPPKAVP